MAKSRGKGQRKGNKDVLNANDVIKSSNAKDSLIHNNLDRFKFKIGDWRNQNTLNYKRFLIRSSRRNDQRIPRQKV